MSVPAGEAVARRCGEVQPRGTVIAPEVVQEIEIGRLPRYLGPGMGLRGSLHARCPPPAACSQNGMLPIENLRRIRGRAPVWRVGAGGDAYFLSIRHHCQQQPLFVCWARHPQQFCPEERGRNVQEGLATRYLVLKLSCAQCWNPPHQMSMCHLRSMIPPPVVFVP